MKILNFILFLTILTLFSSCSNSTVDAGNVGIKVYLSGAKKGTIETLGVGRYYIGMYEQLHVYPTFTQNYVWTKDKAEGSENDESIHFQTKNGLEVDGDFGITYHIVEDSVPLLFESYRRGIDEITDTYLRNEVRDAINSTASKMEITSLYGEGKSFLMQEVLNKVKNTVGNKGIHIDKIYIIGKFRLPASVQKAIEAKSNATQTAMTRENELRGAEAMAKTKLVRAQAEASANEILTKSITPALLKWKQLELMEKKWNGALPRVTSGDGNLLLQVNAD